MLAKYWRRLLIGETSDVTDPSFPPAGDVAASAIAKEPVAANDALTTGTEPAPPQIAPADAVADPVAGPASTAQGTGGILHIVDIIPVSDSAEMDQNSEPSIAVNPLNPNQIIVGSFSSTFVGAGIVSPYFVSINGGATWSNYDNVPTEDKSIAWKQDGSAALTATLFTDVISTYSGTATSSGFGSPIGTFNPVQHLDQPWIRTGPSNHVYIAYNDPDATLGRTASVLVSTNGGSSFTPVTLDRVGGGAGDAASVRLAVNGSTVYSAFTRWNSVLDTDSDGETRYNAQVVIVRSDNGGADGFTALGNGVQVAAPISWLANTQDGALTLGHERTSADLAIAVDPNDASHVLVAYGGAPGWSLVGTGDYNGDSKSDLLWRNTTTGVFTEWQSNGNGFTPNVLVNASVSASWTPQSSPTHLHA